MSYEDHTQEARAPLKKLLSFTENGAKSPLSADHYRDLILEASNPCPLLVATGMHKIENPSIPGTHFF